MLFSKSIPHTPFKNFLNQRLLEKIWEYRALLVDADGAFLMQSDAGTIAAASQ